MIDEKRKIELFDEFYEWLKNDGLKAIKSERLHKKKIFSSLLNNHQMTLDNFTDFNRLQFEKAFLPISVIITPGILSSSK